MTGQKKPIRNSEDFQRAMKAMLAERGLTYDPEVAKSRMGTTIAFTPLFSVREARERRARQQETQERVQVEEAIMEFLPNPDVVALRRASILNSLDPELRKRFVDTLEGRTAEREITQQQLIDSIGGSIELILNSLSVLEKEGRITRTGVGTEEDPFIYKCFRFTHYPRR
jgi:hypothetical protein